MLDKDQYPIQFIGNTLYIYPLNLAQGVNPLTGDIFTIESAVDWYVDTYNQSLGEFFLKKFYDFFSTHYGDVPKKIKELVDGTESIIDKLKTAKCADIDKKTDMLVKKTGFVFGGKQFSMSDKAQTNWNMIVSALYSSKELVAKGAMQQAQFNAFFPVRIFTITDEIFELPNETMVLAFYMAFTQYQSDPSSPLVIGRVLRNKVMSATTVEEIDAIVDNREI